MPVITDPGEPYFKDGIWGWDAAADLWLPLAADPATNRLIVNAHGDIEVHQDTPADMQVGAHGWDGAAWHRLPMVFGYSSQYTEQEFTLTAAAGADTLTFSTVPADEIWYIQGVSAVDTTTNVSFIMIRHHTALAVAWLYQVYPTQAYQVITLSRPVILKKDDFLTVYFDGTILNDDIYAWAWGYKMLIAE